MTSERTKALLNLINLSAAYKACFLDKETGELTPAAARVLHDLGHFSALSKSPLKVSPISRQVDTHATCTAIGRAEPVRRIWDFIRLDPTNHPLTKEQEHE